MVKSQINTSNKKIQARYTASYNWAMQCSLQEINQVLKGVEKTIEWEENGEMLSTGVSSTDRAAIEQALNYRLLIEKNKK